MPAHNSSEFISEAVDCVLSQTYDSIELIIIDDGSTDDTLNIINQLAKNNNKVKIIEQDKHGVAHARNTGIATASGEYIAFLDSDDYWFKDKLQLQVKHLVTHQDVGAVFCNWKTWEPQQGEYPPPTTLEPVTVSNEIDPVQSGWLYGKLLFDCIIHTSGIVIRKAVLDKTGGFDETLKIGEDYDLWIRLSQTTKIDKLLAPLSLYRLNPESITNKKPLDVNYRLLVINNNIQRYGYSNNAENSLPIDPISINRQLAKICFSYGYQHYKANNYRTAIRSMAEATKYDYKDLGLWKKIMLAIANMAMLKTKEILHIATRP
jgi:glycosyltransferase involved in cell wall biosynthesis